MMTRCKRCGGVLMLPADEAPGEPRRLRDAIIGGTRDEDLDYLHWDYREVKDTSIEERIASGTIWALCNDCDRN